MLPAEPVESLNERHGIGGGPIEGRGYAALERDLDIGGVVRSRARRPCQRVDILRWLLPRIFQYASFDAAMPEILVDAVWLLSGRRDWNPVRRRVLDFVFARSQRPLAPRSDDSQVRGQRLIGKFEAHLIIPLAGTSMREGVRAFRQRDLNLDSGNERPRQRRAEEILPLVHRVGPQRWKEVLGGKLRFGIHHLRGIRAAGQGLAA